MNLNKVFLIGRLTSDVNLRMTPSGQPVASFGVATNRTWTDKNGQKQEEAEFHNVVVWGRQAELANQYLAKGRLVMIEGRLRTRSYQTAQGEKRVRTEIITERMQFGPKAMGAQEGFGSSAQVGLPKVDEARQQEAQEALATIDLNEPPLDIAAKDEPASFGEDNPPF